MKCKSDDFDIRNHKVCDGGVMEGLGSHLASSQAMHSMGSSLTIDAWDGTRLMMGDETISAASGEDVGWRFRVAIHSCMAPIRDGIMRDGME